jgi:cytochrome c oxidase subunit 2
MAHAHLRKPASHRCRNPLARAISLLGVVLLRTQSSFAFAQASPVPNIFKPASTPAHAELHLSIFVLVICGLIFVIVGGLLVYAIVKFRRRGDEDGPEPAPVYGSNQMELAWTVVPCLIVFVLFLATARVIHSVQEAVPPPTAIQVTAIGHQFWWEYRYPDLGVVTANELHVPVSTAQNPAPTFIKLLSADTDHSFWVPQLAGKTDLIPNQKNSTWIEPHATGVYLGQCAQYCGTQHALMLLRVYVDTPEDFARWVAAQKQPAVSNDAVAKGRRIFEQTSCINCHAVSGTAANGVFGPDLTHLMSRDTIASGAVKNTPENLKQWIRNPDSLKPGSLMPAMNLSAQDLDNLTAYLETLR